MDDNSPQKIALVVPVPEEHCTREKPDAWQIVNPFRITQQIHGEKEYRHSKTRKTECAKLTPEVDTHNEYLKIALPNTRRVAPEDSLRSRCPQLV